MPSFSSCLFMACLLPFFASTGFGESLKKDEELIVFPSYVTEGQNQSLRLSFRAWIYEPEAGSLWRQALIKTLETFVPKARSAAEEKNLQRRLHGFTVDNKRNKAIDLRLSQLSFTPGVTKADGHLQSEWTFTLPESERKALAKQQLALTWERGGRQIPIWIGAEGLSVISDIDDTIKISQVLDRKALLENTLLKDFRPVPGMAELYRQLAAQGAIFHYISASPWQLYPDLQAFLQTYFPPGTISLRMLRLKDSTGFDFFFGNSALHKIETLTHFLQRFPARKFLLIGDSGEKDPEIYAEIRRRFPQQVLAILIRIPPEQISVERLAGIDYFREPAETLSQLQRLQLIP